MFETISLDLTTDPQELPLPSFVPESAPGGCRWLILIEPTTGSIELGTSTDAYPLQPATETISATAYPVTYATRPTHIWMTAGEADETVSITFQGV